MTLISKKSDKVFDDSLEDLGGLALFDPTRTDHMSEYTWLNQADVKDWETLGRLYYGYNKGDVYVRFVDPTHARFGSIARITQFSYYWHGSPSKPNTLQQDATVRQFSTYQNFSGELHWAGRSSKPSFYSRDEHVEWLPDYKGDTVWKFDRERNQRVKYEPALDKLGREIKVGDFCAYILYQFEGRNAAGIYFGNVTKVEPDGQVWCRNVKLDSNGRQAEMAVKDNSLITILTDDLMRQLMMAKLSNG